MKRSKLQEVSSNHTWARSHLKGLHTLMHKSWPNKEIKIPPGIKIKVHLALQDLDTAIRDSYINYKRRERK